MPQAHLVVEHIGALLPEEVDLKGYFGIAPNPCMGPHETAAAGQRRA